MVIFTTFANSECHFGPGDKLFEYKYRLQSHFLVEILYRNKIDHDQLRLIAKKVTLLFVTDRKEFSI